MLGMFNARTIHVPGTLAADLDIRINVPIDCHLTRVSAVTSNDSDATLAIGVSTDEDSILVATTIGDGQTPQVFTRANWATTNPDGELSKGDILVLTVDYDGALGTAADDLTIDLAFVEG